MLAERVFEKITNDKSTVNSAIHEFWQKGYAIAPGFPEDPGSENGELLTSYNNGTVLTWSGNCSDLPRGRAICIIARIAGYETLSDAKDDHFRKIRYSVHDANLSRNARGRFWWLTDEEYALYHGDSIEWVIAIAKDQRFRNGLPIYINEDRHKELLAIAVKERASYSAKIFNDTGPISLLEQYTGLIKNGLLFVPDADKADQPPLANVDAQGE